MRVREVLGYYYRSLVFRDLGRQKQLEEINVKIVIVLTVEQFLKWELKILEPILNGSDAE